MNPPYVSKKILSSIWQIALFVRFQWLLQLLQQLYKMGFRLISHEVNAAVMFKTHLHSCKTFSKYIVFQNKFNSNAAVMPLCVLALKNQFDDWSDNRWEGRTMDSILSSKLFSWGTTCGPSLTKRNCDSSWVSFGFKGQCGHDMTNGWKVRKGAIPPPIKCICLQ